MRYIMKTKLTLIGLALSLMYIACEEETEIDPCAALATASTDAATAYSEALLSDPTGDNSALCTANVAAYQAGLNGGCDGFDQAGLDALQATCAQADFSGTYNITSLVIHPGGDCSADDGISGVCFPDFGLSEADCPTGDCNCSEVMDGVTTEEDCDDADGDWDEDNQECEQDCDATTEEECEDADGEWYSGGFCMDMETGDGMEGIEEADCSANGGVWIVFGWNLYADVFTVGWSITFAYDGTFTDWEDESGTWTLDGSTLTMTDSEGETITATVSGNTITLEDAYEAHCDDDTYTDEQSCEEAGYGWNDAECVEMVFTSSGS